MRFGGDWTPQSLSDSMTGCLGTFKKNDITSEQLWSFFSPGGIFGSEHPPKPAACFSNASHLRVTAGTMIRAYENHGFPLIRQGY